jgi:hypothetical protein
MGEIDGASFKGDSTRGEPFRIGDEVDDPISTDSTCIEAPLAMESKDLTELIVVRLSIYRFTSILFIK